MNQQWSTEIASMAGFLTSAFASPSGLFAEGNGMEVKFEDRGHIVEIAQAVAGLLYSYDVNGNIKPEVEGRDSWFVAVDVIGSHRITAGDRDLKTIQALTEGCILNETTRATGLEYYEYVRSGSAEAQAVHDEAQKRLAERQEKAEERHTKRMEAATLHKLRRSDPTFLAQELGRTEQKLQTAQKELEAATSRAAVLEQNVKDMETEYSQKSGCNILLGLGFLLVSGVAGLLCCGALLDEQKEQLTGQKAEPENVDQPWAVRIMNRGISSVESIVRVITNSYEEPQNEKVPAAPGR